MGGVFSRHRTDAEDEASVSAYKFPPKSSNYFGSYFFMGGSVFEMIQPETFLFGDPNDLNFLSSRPTQFPYPLTYDNEPTRALRALVNVRKDSVRLVRASATQAAIQGSSQSAGVSEGEAVTQSQLYNIEFTFDSDVRCAITIYYCAHEEFRDGALHYTSRRGSSGTYRYKRGTNQLFSQPAHVLDANRIDEPLDARRDVYPIVIHCVAECEDYAGHSHVTVCTLERPSGVQGSGANGGSVSSDLASSGSLSGSAPAVTSESERPVESVSSTASVKVVKQKQVIDGLVYVLEEIYGIENKISKQIQALRNGQPVDADAVSELGDTGMECVICMCEPRDTLILPCRHLCLCSVCAENLRFQASNCPICRAPFRALLQIRALRRRPPPSNTRMLTPSILVNDVLPSSGNSMADNHVVRREDESMQQNRPNSPEIPPGYEIVSLVEALNGLTCPLTGANPNRASLIRGNTPVPAPLGSRFDAPGPSGLHQRTHSSHRSANASRPHSQHLNSMHRVVLNAAVERDGEPVGVAAAPPAQEVVVSGNIRKYVPSELNNMNADEDEEEDEEDGERDGSRCAAERDRDAVMMNIVHSNLDSSERVAAAVNSGAQATGKLSGLDELVRDNESVTTECSELVSIAANLAREQAGPNVSVVYVHKPNVKSAAAAAAAAATQPKNAEDSAASEPTAAPSASWGSGRPAFQPGYPPPYASRPSYPQNPNRAFPASSQGPQRPVYSSMSVESSDTSAMSGVSEQDELGWFEDSAQAAPCVCHGCAVHAPPPMGDMPPIGAATHIHHAHQITTTCYSTTIHHGHIAAAYPGVNVPLGHAASMSHTHTTTMSVCCCAPPAGVPVANVMQHAAVQHSVQHTSIVQHSVHHFDAAYPMPVPVPPAHHNTHARRGPQTPAKAPTAQTTSPEVFLPEDQPTRMNKRAGNSAATRLSLQVPRNGVMDSASATDASVYGTCSAASIVGSSTAATDGCSSAEQSAAGSLPDTPDTNRDVLDIQRQLQTAAYLNQQTQAQQFVLNVPRSARNSQKTSQNVVVVVGNNAPKPSASAQQRNHHEVRQERIHEESDEDNENEAEVIEMHQFTNNEPRESED